MKPFNLIIWIFIAFSCTPSSETSMPEAEYVKLGRQIEYAINSGKLEFIEKKFNQQYIFNKLNHLVDSLDIRKDDFRQGANVKKLVIVQEFEEYLDHLSKMAVAGEFRFIRHLDNDGHSLLFGMDYRDAVDFIEFDLVTRGEEIHITDYFLYFKGLRYSDYFAWREVNRLFYGNLGGPFVEAWDLFNSAMIYNEQGYTEKAWAAYQRIPGEFAYHPVFHGTKEEIARSLSDSIFEETLYEKIGIHWDEPKTRYMNLAYYYRVFNMPDTSMIYLDSLQAITGRNFVMDSLRLQVENLRDEPDS